MKPGFLCFQLLNLMLGLQMCQLSLHNMSPIVHFQTLIYSIQPSFTILRDHCTRRNLFIKQSIQKWLLWGKMGMRLEESK
ncbi:hypothetical protein CY35_01G161600 [Sphagnum magellanicum]|nr:hypothetical protein CY35_01G161600 [Sphagnum magellanicum]